jgi:hypothetical protein
MLKIFIAVACGLEYGGILYTVFRSHLLQNVILKVVYLNYQERGEYSEPVAGPLVVADIHTKCAKMNSAF